MSYAMSMVEGYRTVGAYAARILNGENPADLPVQQSSKSELVINLKAAKALGIEVPADILVRACRLFDQKRPKHLRLRLAWPLEDLADIRAGTCKQVRLVRRIGHEAIDVREVIMRYIAGIWLSAASATS
jgi:hypothetical protein